MKTLCLLFWLAFEAVLVAWFVAIVTSSVLFCGIIVELLAKAH